ncbi:MAG TPA: transporter substrate-binding domain-containing protein [Oligoflexus sp.]|uniref:substrate-binding periplasmic protein n=1 Tax=Oligoflexus sp. TaxID=1971216 RepID=UPI002D6A7715|nr:transporter substrate-binding domain-containing protein [Oligoflexus sp.]HYX37791.1 transporter substrate-binding domain-containing protein [Oligoflexus sp.]
MVKLVSIFLGLTLIPGSPVAANALYKVAVLQIGGAGTDAKAPNISMAKAYCEKAKVNCEIVPLPTTRAFSELQANRVQFLISLDHDSSTPASEKITKIETVSIVVIARKEVRGCEDLNSMTLAAFRNVLYAKKLTQKCPGLKITWTNTYPQAIQMYRSKRVQGVLGVARNFDQKSAFVVLQREDIKSQVGVEDVWLFGNESSGNSEAALKFLSMRR